MKMEHPSRPEQIISGMQTGADQAGLRAAERCGIPTGGYAPKDFMTETGPQSAVGLRYGLEETRYSDYRVRTRMNIDSSDGTIIFTRASLRGGSLMTYNHCTRVGKPVLHIQSSIDQLDMLTASTVRGFVRSNRIRTLNIAGSRESSAPEIGEFVERVLVEAFGEK